MIENAIPQGIAGVRDFFCRRQTMLMKTEYPGVEEQYTKLLAELDAGNTVGAQNALQEEHDFLTWVKTGANYKHRDGCSPKQIAFYYSTTNIEDRLAEVISLLKTIQEPIHVPVLP